MTMLQELSLFSQVAAADQPTLRRQLAALNRMPPQPVLGRHVVFKPAVRDGQLSAGGTNHGVASTNTPGIAGGINGSTAGYNDPNQQEEMRKVRQIINAPLNYVHLVGMWKHIGRRQPTSKKEEANDGPEPEYNHNEPDVIWNLEYRDIPEAGKMSVTSRPMSRKQILAENAIQYVRNLGCEYQNHYTVQGEKFYDHDRSMSFFLHRILRESQFDDTLPATNGNADRSSDEQPSLDASLTQLPDPYSMTPFDPSNSFILQISIEVSTSNSNSSSSTALPASASSSTTAADMSTSETKADINSAIAQHFQGRRQDSVQKSLQPQQSQQTTTSQRQQLEDIATKHLLAVKDILAGCGVKMAPGDRLALDTRVKNGVVSR